MVFSSVCDVEVLGVGRGYFWAFCVCFPCISDMHGLCTVLYIWVLSFIVGFHLCFGLIVWAI